MRSLTKRKKKRNIHEVTYKKKEKRNIHEVTYKKKEKKKHT